MLEYKYNYRCLFKMEEKDNNDSTFISSVDICIIKEIGSIC